MKPLGISPWDARSDQPYPARRGERAALRYGYATETIRHISAAARCLPTFPLHWCGAKSLGYATSPSPRELIGLALSARSAPIATLRKLIETSGIGHALLRVPVWQRRQLDQSLELVRTLPQIDWLITIVQDRNSILDPQRWYDDLHRIIGTFRPYTPWFQIGQAPNRRKWGCAHLGEYEGLLQAAKTMKQEDSDLHLAGPGLLDFDPVSQIRLSGITNAFDAQTLGLYVDRRGPPEGRQFGLDFAGKIRVSAALAAHNLPRPKRRLWISEANWPLSVPGGWAPAGPRYQVSEERYADYMERYLAIAARSRLIERVYWWQPIARGYGLIDDRNFRPRPAWRRFCSLLATNRF